MKVLLTANYVTGKFFGLAGREYDVDDGTAHALIANAGAIVVGVATPAKEGLSVEVIPEARPDASVPGPPSPKDLSCPFGCRDGKPFANRGARDAHVVSKHGQ